MTFQGLVPFVYEEYDGPPAEEGGLTGKRGQGVEVDRCRWNNMRDNPKTKGGECRGPVKGVTDCVDCRETPVEEIGSVHFTLCQKARMDEERKAGRRAVQCHN
jgi:hypothetical protein